MMDATIDQESPLLFFDSGVGGLSVLDAVTEKTPQASIVYVADQAFLPYGEKSESEISTRVPALLGRMVERFNPRLVVIACNTACTIALSHVRSALDIPVVGTVPAIKPAAEFSRSKVIGLLGTEATIRQGYVDRLQEKHAANCTLIRAAAPELVMAAEAKLRGESVDKAIFERAIRALYDQDDAFYMDAIVLGCTHFPILRDELRHALELDVGMSPDTRLFDGADGIARRVTHLTEGQSWKADELGHIFVTTDNIDTLNHYKPALQQRGFKQFHRL